MKNRSIASTAAVVAAQGGSSDDDEGPSKNKISFMGKRCRSSCFRFSRRMPLT